MTATRNTFTIALGFAAISFAALGTATIAEAGRAKEVFVQDYKFNKPMHGYSGHSGNYYCDYQRLPNRKCTLSANGKETCKIVSWTLREMCQ